MTEREGPDARSEDRPRVTLGAVVGDRVRHYRDLLNLRQQDLADRTAALGAPISRAVIAKIEGGHGQRAENLTVRDLFALGLALEVPPTVLLLPLEDACFVALTPEVAVTPRQAFEWLTGHRWLAPSLQGPLGTHPKAAKILQSSSTVSDLENAAVSTYRRLGRGQDLERTLAYLADAIEASTVNIPSPSFDEQPELLEDYKLAILGRNRRLEDISSIRQTLELARDRAYRSEEGDDEEVRDGAWQSVDAIEALLAEATNSRLYSARAELAIQLLGQGPHDVALRQGDDDSVNS